MVPPLCWHTRPIADTLQIQRSSCAPCSVLVQCRADKRVVADLSCSLAGVVVTLARKYRVSLPVLTAVAQVLNGHLNAKEAVYEIMNLPQIEER